MFHRHGLLAFIRLEAHSILIQWLVLEDLASRGHEVF